MKERTVYIYGLTDPNGYIRYVGQSVNPQARYEQHMADDADTPKTRWIQGLSKNGSKPGLIILEKTDQPTANFAEKWWMTLGKKRGWQLSNSKSVPGKNPNFTELFAEQLREDFEQFAIDHDLVLLVTRRHIYQATRALHILIGVILGVFIGWNTYLLELTFQSPLLVAICYGFVCFVIIAHLNFLWATGSFKKNARKNLTLSGVALLHVLASVLASKVAA